MNRRQVYFLGIPYVDGGLVMPILARGKLRVQVTPMAGAVLVAVVPEVWRMCFLSSAIHDQDKRAANDSNKLTRTYVHIHHSRREVYLAT